MIWKENTGNISIIKYVLSKRKPKRRHSDVDVGYNSRWVIYICRISRECYPIRMIGYSYQFFSFLISWTWYGAYYWPRQFLNEYDIIWIASFKYSVNNKIVLVNILWENSDFLYNHISAVFTAEWIDCLLFSQSFWYFLECHSLLKWCHQKEHWLEPAWWLSLQFEYLNM